jgi:hypothetical protein
VPLPESCFKHPFGTFNTQTGNVSPQFHCIYDDEFATCERDAKFTSLWQFKAQLQLKPDATDRTDVLPTLAPGRYNEYNLNLPVLPPAAAPIDQFVEPWDHVSKRHRMMFPFRLPTQ